MNDVNRMDTTADPAAIPKSSGRATLWVGVSTCLLGLIAYMAQLEAGKLSVPWYAPALGVLGTALVVRSLRHRRSAWRVAALLLLVALTAGELWFLLSYCRLPPYTGPVTAGEPFPAFTAARADGTPFTREDLKGTVLVFFRGWW
jgi:hypothetical protein